MACTLCFKRILLSLSLTIVVFSQSNPCWESYINENCNTNELTGHYLGRQGVPVSYGNGYVKCCYKCPWGSYSDKSGSYYANDGFTPDSDRCAKCPVGTFSRVQGSASIDNCVACASGFFNDLPGSSECVACPANTTSNARASSCAPTATYLLVTCLMQAFPSRDVVGNVIGELPLTTEQECKSACCDNIACMGYSFFRPEVLSRAAQFWAAT